MNERSPNVAEPQDGAETPGDGVLWITAEDGGETAVLGEDTPDGDGVAAYRIHLDAPAGHDVWVRYGLAEPHAHPGVADQWARIPRGKTSIDVELWILRAERGDWTIPFDLRLKSAARHEGGEAWGVILESAARVETRLPGRVGETEEGPPDDTSWQRSGGEENEGARATPEPEAKPESSPPPVADGGDERHGREPVDADSATAVFSGASTDYVITLNRDGSFTIQDRVEGRDGVDRLTGARRFQFADGTFDLETMADFAALGIEDIARPWGDEDWGDGLSRMEFGAETDEPFGLDDASPPGTASFQFGDKVYGAADLEPLLRGADGGAGSRGDSAGWACADDAERTED